MLDGPIMQISLWLALKNHLFISNNYKGIEEEG